MPPEKKLTFLPNHRDMIPFPFEAFQQTYHGAFPDIVISFPGQPLRKSVWKDIAALVSIRSSPDDDPFREDADKGCHRTLLRIAKDACTLMAMRPRPRVRRCTGVALPGQGGATPARGEDTRRLCPGQADGTTVAVPARSFSSRAAGQNLLAVPAVRPVSLIAPRLRAAP